MYYFGCVSFFKILTSSLNPLEASSPFCYNSFVIYSDTGLHLIPYKLTLPWILGLLNLESFSPPASLGDVLHRRKIVL